MLQQEPLQDFPIEEITVQDKNLWAFGRQLFTLLSVGLCMSCSLLSH